MIKNSSAPAFRMVVKIGVDVDGILINLGQAFCDFVYEEQGIRLAFTETATFDEPSRRKPNTTEIN